ncbi:MAG: septum formation inhibitor Maf [Lachnospiraceae bacterium]|jgi:septum formation protein|nr:septum formation inhibitor Maf [Lachnospiraceae bacterium]
MKQRLILASASPRRSQLMRQIGLKPEIMPSMAEEVIDGLDPKALVMELSRQKAEDVAGKYQEGTVVIGADTVVSIDGRILGKPSNHREAAEMICLLQGRVHQVYTGVTIVWNGSCKKKVTFAEQTDVSVYPMSEEEIYRYVESGEPMDKAGAYGIQGKFAAYIQEIHGDYNNVVGLPAGRLYQELKALGVVGEEYD